MQIRTDMSTFGSDLPRFERYMKLTEQEPEVQQNNSWKRIAVAAVTLMNNNRARLEEIERILGQIGCIDKQ